MIYSIPFRKIDHENIHKSLLLEIEEDVIDINKLNAKPESKMLSLKNIESLRYFNKFEFELEEDNKDKIDILENSDEFEELYEEKYLGTKYADNTAQVEQFVGSINVKKINSILHFIGRI